MKYLLDTHAWIWWHMRPEKLSPAVHDLIGSPNGDLELLLSAISPWEFCKIVEKRRMQIAVDPQSWLDLALAMPGLRLVPLTPVIAYRSTVLPPPFHSDPADQIIVATGLVESATIITVDGLITAYPHVQTFW